MIRGLLSTLPIFPICSVMNLYLLISYYTCSSYFLYLVTVSFYDTYCRRLLKHVGVKHLISLRLKSTMTGRNKVRKLSWFYERYHWMIPLFLLQFQFSSQASFSRSDRCRIVLISFSQVLLTGTAPISERNLFFT